MRLDPLLTEGADTHSARAIGPNDARLTGGTLCRARTAAIHGRLSTVLHGVIARRRPTSP
jgi:hypothetical protein